MDGTVRIACWAAFWGDTRHAARQVLGESDIDYLVADYLSEITMALLARARAKDPEGGFIQEAIDVLVPVLPELSARGIKVVTNAGGLNPAACARALQTAVDEAGLSLRVAAIEGDDLSPQREELLAARPHDMFTGAQLPDEPLTMNAYLGARPIAQALGSGADIVVTGRCVDSAVVLGPLMHEFGWGDDDHDLLSAGTLAGHVIECGPQCTGGNFTDWESVPGWENMGYPIAECRADGTTVITKPEGTGGLVTTATVGEQIVYEIGDPGAYVMPEVVCDWREVQLEQVGEDRVRISGARGTAPTSTYKVTATHADGYRVLTTAMFAGAEAAGRARRAAEAVLARSERLVLDAGYGPMEETSVEVVGAGPDATEVVVKLGARHQERAALEIVSTEFAPFALVAQGMTGFFAGRPRVAPVIRVYHFLIEKGDVQVTVRLGDEVQDVATAAGDATLRRSPLLPDGTIVEPSDGVSVPLRQLAYARSGDKGDQANIGVLARRPDYLPIIRDQVTASRVRAHFGSHVAGDVRGWELPGLGAINFLLDAALGGTGGTSTLRYDAQGKSFAAMLLTLPVVVPPDLELAPVTRRGS